MNDAVDVLWSQLRALLKARGDLPLRYELLTPGEVAGYISAASADARVQRFVWDYYYPQRYGHMEGAISDAEAKQLIASLVGRPVATATFDPDIFPAANAAAQSGESARAPCGLCGRRGTDGHRV